MASLRVERDGHRTPFTFCFLHLVPSEREEMLDKRKEEMEDKRDSPPLGKEGQRRTPVRPVISLSLF
jgi:hypothetical protein